MTRQLEWLLMLLTGLVSAIALTPDAKADDAQTTDDLNLHAMIQPVDDHNIYKPAGYETWGGNIVKDGDTYYLVHSRWLTDGGHWLYTSEIALAVANNPLGPYKPLKVILKGRGEGHWDELTAHNPKVKKFGDKYYLYYISSRSGPTYGHTRDSQRIGVAIAEHITGPYEHLDTPIVEPSKPVFNITVNPGVVKTPQGDFLMILKGDIKPKRPTERMPQRVQGLAKSEQPEGPFRIQPYLALADFDTEDASIWYDQQRKRYYAIFHAHSHIGLITSTDGRHWQKARHYEVTQKTFPGKGNDPYEVRSIERPFVFIEDYQPRVLCLSIRKHGSKAMMCLLVPLEE